MKLFKFSKRRENIESHFDKRHSIPSRSERNRKSNGSNKSKVSSSQIKIRVICFSENLRLQVQGMRLKKAQTAKKKYFEMLYIRGKIMQLYFYERFLKIIMQIHKKCAWVNNIAPEAVSKSALSIISTSF